MQTAVDGIDLVEIVPSTRSLLPASELRLKDISPPVPQASHLIHRASTIPTAVPPSQVLTHGGGGGLGGLSGNSGLHHSSSTGKPLQFFDFGSYASFAPTYDSTDAAVDYEDFCNYALQVPLYSMISQVGIVRMAA